MKTTPAPCCDDYRTTSRRGFLRGSLALGGATAITVAHGSVLTQTAYAAEPAEQVLVVLSMRGAADGLSLVVPHADPTYYAARPSIAVPSDRLLVKNGMFGLHPALAPLLPLWNAGKVATIQATGLPVANRSHFSAMEEVEDADPGSAARVGWLNRLVGRDGTGSPIEAVQMGGGVPSAAICGPEPVLVTGGVDTVQLAGADAITEAGRKNALNAAWAGATGDLGNGLRSALQVVSDFAPVRSSSTTPQNGAAYPSGGLGDALHASARTIRADVGAEIITVDHGSWDHHTWIGQPDNGNIKNMATEFATAVAAFFADLGPLASKVTLVTISEFGRRVVENANQGLDHGYGNVMFAMGAGVKGGYYGTWPGLTKTTDADLLVTTDYRSVLNEVITTRMNASTATVFPGFAPKTTGFMTSL
ncbi:DUF1501 domain-containing protein [Nocardioides sp.]|uniref:DUF1501 domain-containing protein n=1 Tax=Nocardioides sp. TaxID=35761 RepID=UPI0027259BAC|nr:DUF1501 domain-containing protein [Nocardioides sp.]MDO9457718.1 DUF1501 domain-containing protein [Nocardioides sp.]